MSTTENFDGFLNIYNRMTERLADLVTQLSLETSCKGAARIMCSMNIAISGDTVIRTLIKRCDKQPLTSHIKEQFVDTSYYLLTLKH